MPSSRGVGSVYDLDPGPIRLDRRPEPQPTNADRLLFGLYPGGVAGTTDGLTVGPPDDADRINPILDAIQGSSPLLVRSYIEYAEQDIRYGDAPRDPAQYARNGRKLDIVLFYFPERADLGRWLAHVREKIQTLGPYLGAVQLTEEPNLPAFPGNGGSPGVIEALCRGVEVARAELDQLGIDAKVGFNCVTPSQGDEAFWQALRTVGGTELGSMVDYVGLDVFPDVLRPLDEAQAVEMASDAVIASLDTLRDRLALAGFPSSTRLRITEHGWPTGPMRSEQQQASMIEAVIRTVDKYRGNYNVEAYELFALRDADSQNTDLFHQFGILRDDSPKLAFHALTDLVRELGR